MFEHLVPNYWVVGGTFIKWDLIKSVWLRTEVIGVIYRLFLVSLFGAVTKFNE